MKNALKKIPLARWFARKTRRARKRARARWNELRAAMARGRGSRASDRALLATDDRRFADEFALARVEWRDQGPTAYLLDRARSMMLNTVAWRLLPPAMWMVYCAVLLEHGDRATAERLLRSYLAQGLPADAIARCLPVARLARDLGLASDAALRSATAADALEQAQQHDAFARLVATGSVAVVGNGPGNLASGLGDEIDRHDVVIRFNNFPDGYAADYGTRTDIWVRGAHRDVRDRADVESFSLVLWEMDLFRNLLEAPAHSEILYRDTLFSPGRITHIGTETKARLRERSGLLLPTSGAQLLWLLHEVRGSLEGVDVYGFSTLDGNDDHGHYFDALGDMTERHDVRREAEFLRGLLVEHLLTDLDADAAPPPPAGERSGEVTVFGCAYREYDPASGKTGGPGGVLATQRFALGDEYRGARLEYLFQGADAAELRRRFAVTTAGLSTKIAEIVVAGEYIRSHPDILAARERGDVLLVCHELGTAYGAHRLGIPYVLVYHQQGSTLQEMRSIGRVPTPREVHVASALEKLICDGAQQVFFPSLGARDAYLATSHSEVSGVNFADRALYNTVSAVDHGDETTQRRALLDQLMKELRLPARDADTDVFISVGDFNEDKGLDRVPALLSRHAELSGRKVVWIAIGASSDPARFDALVKQQRQWPFTARLIGERTTHDRLLALLDYADYYVMMHRNAIFDLATLEAMRAGKALILSPVGGNLEVDLGSNVLFVDEDTLLDACRVIETRDKRMWGERNRAVFEEHFSLDRFTERYRRMLDEQLDRLGAPADASPHESHEGASA